eukprot:9093847-Alexandrium_andersonii.AAC.1
MTRGANASGSECLCAQARHEPRNAMGNNGQARPALPSPTRLIMRASSLYWASQVQLRARAVLRSSGANSHDSICDPLYTPLRVVLLRPLGLPPGPPAQPRSWPDSESARTTAHNYAFKSSGESIWVHAGELLS